MLVAHFHHTIITYLDSQNKESIQIGKITRGDRDSGGDITASSRKTDLLAYIVGSTHSTPSIYVI